MFPFYIAWKQQKTFRVFGIVRWYKMGTLARNELTSCIGYEMEDRQNTNINSKF